MSFNSCNKSLFSTLKINTTPNKNCYFYRMRKPGHITSRKVVLIFFFVDLIFVLIPALISFYQFKQSFGNLVGLGPARTFGNFKPVIDISILVVFWLSVFYLFGHYTRNINQSVVKIIRSTVNEVITGNVILFLVVFGPLKMFEYSNSWPLFLTFTAQFILIVSIPRVTAFIILNKFFERGYLKFNTVVTGNSEAVKDFLREFNHSGYLKKHRLAGVMTLDGGDVPEGFTRIRSFAELNDIASEGKIDEVIFIDPDNDFNTIRDIVTFCKKYNIILNIPGELTDILKGQVRISDIDAPPFVVIHSQGLPLIQCMVKRFIDVLFSITGILIMLPALPFIVYKIRESSPGPVIFAQERIGKNGVPFKMFKFRTMYVDAEKGGPALSSDNDKRITTAGRWLRRWRLDELPQLVNVLLGQMSLVGPRPERQYYLQKILEEAPYYSLVLKVKPGITSLGMVKFGYAENIDQMIQRARFDVLYIENQSLMLDMKILFYTIGTLFKGEGK